MEKIILEYADNLVRNPFFQAVALAIRSEERRVGKECKA